MAAAAAAGVASVATVEPASSAEPALAAALGASQQTMLFLAKSDTSWIGPTKAVALTLLLTQTLTLTRTRTPTRTRTRTLTQAHRALLAGWVEAAADQVKLDDEVREQLDGCVREATRSL